MKPLLILILCFESFFVNAQKDSLHQALIRSKTKTLFIKLPDISIKENSSANIFRSIDVIDCREDTSRIGIASLLGASKEICFHVPVAKEVAACINKFYVNGKGKQDLLISIHKLWMYDTLYLNHQTMERVSKHIPCGRLIFRGEAYLKTTSGYIPVTYLDTTVIYNSTVTTFTGTRIATILESLINKVVIQNISIIAEKKKPVPLKRIVSLINNRSIHLIDTACTLQKGVYASFNEFRRNQPSIHDYKMDEGKNKIQQLYLDNADGKQYSSRTIWGYCDGSQSFIMMDGSLFPVMHIQNAYYVWGSREYKVKKFRGPLPLLAASSFLLIGMEPIAVTVDRRMSIFSLDINSGKIY